MRVFFDSEFTGLRQNTTLISIAFVAETGEKLYIEFNDYDKSNIDEWIQTNVIDNLWSAVDKLFWEQGATYHCVSQTEAASLIREWLMGFNEEIVMWGDCLAYDWVLFCELYGGALYIPSCVNYMPLDICTLMSINGINSDTSRKQLSKYNGNQHNALSDAIMIKMCFDYINEYHLKLKL